MEPLQRRRLVSVLRLAVLQGDVGLVGLVVEVRAVHVHRVVVEAVGGVVIKRCQILLPVGSPPSHYDALHALRLTFYSVFVVASGLSETTHLCFNSALRFITLFAYA